MNPGQDGNHAARRRLVDLLAGEVDPDTLGASGADAEEMIRASELAMLVQSALATLEPRDRLLLSLRFEEGLSAAEIARIMDFPTPFHVYRRLNHLLPLLRNTLRRAGVEDAVP